MLAFALSPEEEMIRDTARRFAEERLAARIREHERARGVPPALAAEFSTLGLDAVDLPSAIGGGGLGAFARALVLEELGAVDAGAALALDRVGLAGCALCQLGLDEEVARVRSGTDGRAVLVEDVDGRFRASGGKVSGEAAWIPADRATVAVILQGDRAIVVSQGLALAPIAACGLEAAGASRLTLDRAPAAAVVEDPGAVARSRARIRTHVAALLVGAARGAREYALRYAMDRTAFGRPIAHHQAMAFLIADLATAVDAARLATWQAAASIDGGGEGPWEPAAALAEAAEQALFVGPSAVQILGGHGFMKDHPVEKWMRDIRALASLAGGRDEAEIETARLAPQRSIALA